MSNVITLMRNDIKHLFKNVVSTIIVIGLVIMPSIFAWYNVLACWNVFENTGNLKVAVASKDAGYASDLIPLKVNVGEQVLSALRANEEIDWVFTDSEDAIDGAAAGRYYAAVIIPESFSHDMLTFYTDDAQHASIVYYSNEKKSAIAPKITDKGADSVSYQVNKVFAETLSEIALGIAQALSEYANDAQLESKVSALSDHIKDASQAVVDTANVVGSYIRLMDTIRSTLESASALAASATDGLSPIGISPDSLSTTKDRLDEAIRDAGERLASIEGSLDVPVNPPADLPSLGDSPLDPPIDLSTSPSSNDSEHHTIESAIEAKARKALDELRQKFEDELKPATIALSDVLGQAAANIESGTAKLDDAARTMEQAASSAASGFSDASQKLASIEDELRRASESLLDLADKMDSTLASANSEELRGIIGSDIEAFSAALSAPVEIERIAVFPSETFGSAMAPLYTTLALFIGSLLIMVVVRPMVSNDALSELRNPKPWQTFMGRFGTVAFISLMQTTLMGLGNIFFLQVHAIHPWLLMACFWFSGLVFSFIVYALVSAFANLGKAIAVLMLIIQVTGCGGSFPLQILPGFVQALSPWLPATHVVNAMRAAMMGVYANDFWIEMSMLTLFLVPAALIGLVLRGPLQKFMNWYIGEVESSKLIS